MPNAKCLICNTEFDTIREAQEHQDREHPGLLHPLCSLCGEVTNSNASMTNHLNTCHPGWKERKAPVTKQFTTTFLTKVNTKRGDPMSPEITTTTPLIVTPNMPNRKEGWGFFKGCWYNGGSRGGQYCNQCGFPLLKYPEETDDPQMAKVYVPWIYGKLNEVHYHDIPDGHKFARTFKEALNKQWEIKHD